MYEGFVLGTVKRDALWMEVHKQATICLSRLIKKTGARIPSDDKHDIIMEAECTVMEKLDKKKHVGNVGGIVYYAISNAMKAVRIEFAHMKETQRLTDCVKTSAYMCAEPGCTEMLSSPGFCREHSPKPHIEGLALTAQQAADELGIGRSMIWNLLRSNKIKSFMIEGRRMVARSDLLEYIMSISNK
jgi:excisionase family DNA binding protein